MSLVDKNRFFEVLNSIGGGDYYSPSKEVASSMVDTCLSKKKNIIDMLGGKLRVEREIDTYCSTREAKAILKELTASLVAPHYFFVRQLLKSISVNEFLENKIEQSCTIVDVKIDGGMKLTKALKKLCLKKYHNELITKHSMANQKLFSKGVAVISVDPVDFITMSSNNSGWKSCHRLNGGEYAAGPLSYMLDECSIVCFVESKTPCKTDNYTYSNKIWRQMAMINPCGEYVIQERQYPSANSINADTIGEMFAEILQGDAKTVGVSVDKLAEISSDYFCEEGDDASDCCDTRHYNDIYNRMFSSGKVTSTLTYNEILRGIGSGKIVEPVKGSPVYCVACGEEEVDEAGLLECWSCRRKRIYGEDD